MFFKEDKTVGRAVRARASRASQVPSSSASSLVVGKASQSTARTILSHKAAVHTQGVPLNQTLAGTKADTKSLTSHDGNECRTGAVPTATVEASTLRSTVSSGSSLHVGNDSKETVIMGNRTERRNNGALTSAVRTAATVMEAAMPAVLIAQAEADTTVNTDVPVKEAAETVASLIPAPTAPQSTEAPTVRVPVHVGPLTSRMLSDILQTEQTVTDRVLTGEFKDGVMSLVKADLEVEISRNVLGRFILWAESLTEENFQKILLLFCEAPIPATYTVNLNGVEIPATNTLRQRLAHAIFFPVFPELWDTFTTDGKQRKAVKKLENAVSVARKSIALDKELAEAQVAETIQADIDRLNREAAGEPVTVDAQLAAAQESAAKEAEKTAEATAELEASASGGAPIVKVKPPNTAKTLYSRMMEFTRTPDSKTTKENRDFVNWLFHGCDFSTVDIMKFHGEWMAKGGVSRDRSKWDKAEEARNAARIAAEVKDPIIETINATEVAQ